MRKVLWVVGAAWWVAAATLLALRWVPGGGVVVVALQSGLPIVGLSLVLLVLLSVLARSKGLGALTVLLLAPMLVLASPWWVKPQTQSPAKSDVVVMASNLYFGAADVGELEQAVRRREVSALVLLEVTPRALRQVEASDIPALLPHRSGQARVGADGTMIFTAQPHRELATPDLFFDQVAVEVTAEQEAADPWLLLGAHPVPPTLADWSSDLAALRHWSDAQDPSLDLVMAGDFNASSAHPAFRDLEQDLVDARRATDPGWVRTWPRTSVIPAFIDLDHVLVRGFGVVDAGQVEISGTDHSAVWARVGRSTR
ncbi:MAG: endonuclease/exonuclease/phosphatase family protein [Ornithinimicrobium sp.]